MGTSPEHGQAHGKLFVKTVSHSHAKWLQEGRIVAIQVKTRTHLETWSFLDILGRSHIIVIPKGRTSLWPPTNIWRSGQYRCLYCSFGTALHWYGSRLLCCRCFSCKTLVIVITCAFKETGGKRLSFNFLCDCDCVVWTKVAQAVRMHIQNSAALAWSVFSLKRQYALVENEWNAICITL